jgi:dihydrofolate reductase
MRRVRYRVAASLDGYIAGPNGEIDWIVPDPTVDFAAMFAGFDTALLGRHTYELTRQPGAPPWPVGWRIYVVSRTLPATGHPPAVTVVGSEIEATVASLRAESGRDIWLFGGGRLFASLLAAGLVDRVEVAVMPVILGGGVPLAASGAPRAGLHLTHSDTSPSGIVNLGYDVEPVTRRAD